MTFFDIKDVISVNKIANCRKHAKPQVPARRVFHPDFWKILA